MEWKYVLLIVLSCCSQCCDCASYHHIQWSSVSHGVLLCLDCAGRHRNLGVKVSVVKSLQMDEWEPIEVSLGDAAELLQYESVTTVLIIMCCFVLI